MSETNEIANYAVKVHRSMIRRDLVFGVPRMALFSVFVISMFFIMQFRLYWFIGITIIAIILMRNLTKRDEYFLEFLFHSVLQPDDFYP